MTTACRFSAGCCCFKNIFSLFFHIVSFFPLLFFVVFSLLCRGSGAAFFRRQGKTGFCRVGFLLCLYCFRLILLSFFLFILLFFLCFYLECWDKFKKELWGEGEGELLKWWYENVRQGSGEQDRKARKQRVQCEDRRKTAGRRFSGKAGKFERSGAGKWENNVCSVRIGGRRLVLLVCRCRQTFWNLRGMFVYKALYASADFPGEKFAADRPRCRKE